MTANMAMRAFLVALLFGGLFSACSAPRQSDYWGSLAKSIPVNR